MTPPPPLDPLEPVFMIAQSKLGEPILKLGNRSIESSYAAKKTAEALAAKMNPNQRKCALLIGPGLGYLAKALSARFKKVIAFEPFFQMQQKIAQLEIAQLGMAAERKKAFTVVYNLRELKSALQGLPLPEVIIHPGYEPYVKLEIKQTLQVLKELYGSSKLSLERAIISERSLEAVQSIASFRLFSDLKALKGSAALICPGPSLKKALPELKKWQKKLTIFSAIQAAPLLQSAGVHIDFLVCPDPNDLSAFFMPCTADVKAVLVESAVHLKSKYWLPEKTVLFHYRSDQLHELLWQKSGSLSFDEPIATVAETLVLLAEAMGFGELFCFGMDFCWQQERYAYRAPKTFDSANDLSEKRFFVEKEGQTVETEPVYFQAARYLRLKGIALEEKGIHLYQIGNGLKIANALDESAFAEKMANGPLKEEVLLPPFQPSQELIEEAKSLLKGALELEREPANGQAYSGIAPEEKVMPYFHELPSSERRRLATEKISDLARS
ncbi:MAG: hypothetical protein K0S07_1343 [Chlamydiales bacterium]|nr:hypothetical protein [Chlamydiales bacterium]